MFTGQLLANVVADLTDLCQIGCIGDQRKDLGAIIWVLSTKTQIGHVVYLSKKIYKVPWSAHARAQMGMCAPVPRAYVNGDHTTLVRFCHKHQSESNDSSSRLPV